MSRRERHSNLPLFSKSTERCLPRRPRSPVFIGIWAQCGMAGCDDGMSMAAVPVTDRGQKKKRIVTLALMAIFLMSASFFLIDRKEETIIVVSFPNGREIEAEVADTPEKLLVGLAFRETLPANGGLLYIFETTGQNHLWTKAYRFPVDMIWVDESHHIVGLKENVAPCLEDDCPKYSSSPEAVRYAIQTEAGFIKREGITVGVELKYTLRM
ncbi:MAG: DUF192 domain-containing protein [Nitrospira sp.]|nr:MAG: DUF192 domain-containing protein [Nitrospira sp.]